MHKIQDKEFTLEDFSCEHLNKETKLKLIEVINYLNISRDCFRSDSSRKDYWWQMIQLLPSSYNQTRNVMMNYEVLCNIYKSRKSHPLDEWVKFCKWIESLPYSELICGDEAIMTPNEQREKLEEVADKFCEIGNINLLSKEEIEQAVNLSRMKEN